MCVIENLHEGHRVVKVADAVGEKSEIFSISKVKAEFADALTHSEEFDKKIEQELDNILDEVNKAKEKIARSFEEEHEKLREKETRVLEELERVFNESEEALRSDLYKLKKISEYNRELTETDAKHQRQKITLLEELDLACEMGKQKKKMEDLFSTKITSLKIRWDSERKELSFTKDFFGGTPRISNIIFPVVLRQEVDILWEWDEGNIEGIEYAVEMKEEGETESMWKNVYNGKDNKCTTRGLEMDTEYDVRVKCTIGNIQGSWSDTARVRTKNAYCVWKKCPHVENNKRYSVNWENHAIATKTYHNDWCTIIGNAPFQLNRVTTWYIRVLESFRNDGSGINIGVIPFDVDQNANKNFEKCGWHFCCFDSTLWSGPPHFYRDKAYGLKKEGGQYVHTGDRIGVLIDTTKGELSFFLSGVNLGVAFEGIPLDKPLVHCAILYWKDDSIELDTSNVKENVDRSVPVPPNIKGMNKATWDSITLTWDKVGDAPFYQVEVDRNKKWSIAPSNAFTKRGFLPGTEHSFRVRTVRENSVSEWSEEVGGRTAEKTFEASRWKECPDNVGAKKKYVLDESNLRIAAKAGEDVCTVIGNTTLSASTITTWNIRLVRSKNNNGDGFFIGVAPSDIDQNENNNYMRCGWYFDCYTSALISGPPHNYDEKQYGPQKRSGEYTNTGDSVGVAMDMVKGILTFTLNNVRHGPAYKRIPLDKPLVPCVILDGHEGDSVELVIKDESEDWLMIV